MHLSPWVHQEYISYIYFSLGTVLSCYCSLLYVTQIFCTYSDSLGAASHLVHTTPYCFIDYAKALDCVDPNKLWKILKDMVIPDHLTYLLRNLYAGQEAILRVRYGTTDCVQIGKEYVKAVYCHPAYSTSMQGTSCKMPGWMKQKLESRLLGEISITSDRQMIPPLRQKVKKN